MQPTREGGRGLRVSPARPRQSRRPECWRAWRQDMIAAADGASYRQYVRLRSALRNENSQRTPSSALTSSISLRSLSLSWSCSANVRSITNRGIARFFPATQRQQGSDGARRTPPQCGWRSLSCARMLRTWLAAVCSLMNSVGPDFAVAEAAGDPGARSHTSRAREGRRADRAGDVRRAERRAIRLRSDGHAD